MIEWDVLTVTKRQARPWRGPASVLGWRPLLRVPVEISGGRGPEVGRRLVAAVRAALPRQALAPGPHQGSVLSVLLFWNTRDRCPGPPRTDFQGGRTRGSCYCLGCWFSEAHGLEEAVQVSCSPGRSKALPYDDISWGPHVPWESSSLTHGFCPSEVQVLRRLWSGSSGSQCPG